MIPDIRELNFPDYATLSQATVTIVALGEKTITSQLTIDGQIVPDFSRDWAVEFKGEKYIMPLRQPQGSKDNESVMSTIDLTFHHWAIYQLKRRFFPTMQPIESGTPVPDKYTASVSLNLKDFCSLFGQVLLYYFGDKITIDFNDPETHANGFAYSLEPTTVEISNTHIWDVLAKFYETYAVTWRIEPRDDNSNETEDGERYVIKVGYPANGVTHVFSYGFEGGLLKIERQVQDEDIRNMVIGRGGNKNLPYRYFKRHDADNASFSPDPDWIPELKDIYFSELRGATFRSYIQGWKAAHIKQYRKDYPNEIWTVTVNSPEKAYAPWAWMRGNTDEKFNPIDFVADEFTADDNGYGVKPGSSIALYGEFEGGLDNNEEIYPTIQGIEIDGLGRIDQSVYVDPVTTDNIEQSAASKAEVRSVNGIKMTETLKAGERKDVMVVGSAFSVGEGSHANFDEGTKAVAATKDVYDTSMPWTLLKSKWEGTTERVETEYGAVVIEDATVSLVNLATGESHTASGIPAGEWRYQIAFSLHNTTKDTLHVTVACENPKVVEADDSQQWGDTWSLWVKNIWQTRKGVADSGAVIPNETDRQYAERVWTPILGDREGGEAKVVFSTGLLSTSEDYEFTIVATPEHDTSKTIFQFADGRCSTDESLAQTHGGVVARYSSEWRLTLAKSDADLEATGLYLPSTKRQAESGDCFFFIGIDMPHLYVVEAEKRLDDWKKDELAKVKDTKPTFVVTTDKVKIHNYGNPGAIVDSLHAGDMMTLEDDRFVAGNDHRVSLNITSITYKYEEPTDTEANIIPDVEIVLADDFDTSSGTISQLSGEVSAIQRQIGAVSNIVQILRAVGDRVYLRKDGFAERSLSPTEFASIISSERFRSGIVGGQGWGFFKDENGNWVLETDRINVRQGLQANSIVINQVEGRGGMSIDSAAAIEVSRVAETDDGFVCYFDQRGGSIGNLFKVDDVAYCSQFNPDNSRFRFYKRRVVAVAADSVTLTKGYSAVMLPDGSSDTGVNGDDVPLKGDCLIHYGNYSDHERQYVKVRDVIGGGYERYIEGLDSVNAAGTEYFFVGRQSGVYGGKPRFYVGDENGFICFENGRFTIKAEISAQSTVDGQRLTDYVDKLSEQHLASIEVGTRNLLLNSGGPFATDNSAKNDNTVYPSNLYTSIRLEKGERYTIRAACRIKTFSIAQPYADAVFTSDHNKALSECEAADSALYDVKTHYATLWLWGDGYYQLISDSSTGSVHGTTFVFNGEPGIYHIRLNTYGSVGEFTDLMLVKGDKIASEWTEAPEDTGKAIAAFDYLKRAMADATKENTTVSGGLILTSLIKTGYTGVDSVFYTLSGLGGKYDESRLGYGLAIWAGGEQIDRAEYSEPPSNSAMFAIRQDGTGYAAGNTIKFNRSSLSIGDSIRIDDGGMFMSDGSEERLRVENAPITEDESGAITDNIVISEFIGGNVYIANGHFDLEPVSDTDDNKLQGALSSVNGSGIEDGSILGDSYGIVSPVLPQPVPGGGSSDDTLYIIRGYSNEVFKGQLNSGSKISLKLDMQITGNEKLSGAAFTAVILKDGERVHSLRQPMYYRQAESGDRLWGWNASTDLDFPIAESGEYSIVAGVAASGATADSAEVRVAVSGHATGSVNMPFTTKTVIANNGLLSSWGQSLLFVNHAGAKIRGTDILLKSDRAGFEVHDNEISVVFTENGVTSRMTLADYIRKVVDES